MRSCGGSAVMSSPKKWMLPAVGGKSPVIALNSVVLPAPLEPRIAYFSPAATVSETSSTARTAPKARVTPLRISASPESSAPPPAVVGVAAAALARGLRVVIEAIGAFFPLLAAVRNVARTQAHLHELVL